MDRQNSLQPLICLALLLGPHLHHQLSYTIQGIPEKWSKQSFSTFREGVKNTQRGGSLKFVTKGCWHVVKPNRCVEVRLGFWQNVRNKKSAQKCSKSANLDSRKVIIWWIRNKQVGTEVGQAQLKLGLDFTLIFCTIEIWPAMVEISPKI